MSLPEASIQQMLYLTRLVASSLEIWLLHRMLALLEGHSRSIAHAHRAPITPMHTPLT